MSNSTTSVSNAAGTSSSERFTGRVKWFNNKAGYGFVTVTDGPSAGGDIFVHHSSIKVDSEQYKYLVQGEYVEFTMSSTSTGNHEFQAGEVSGIKGGKLMCETRRELRTTRTQYRSAKGEDDEENAEPVKMPRSVRAPRPQSVKETSAPRARGQGPREDSEWSYVSRAKKGEQQDSAPVSPQKRSVGGRGPGRPRAAPKAEAKA
jgi:CspA family cold shock protein